MKKVLGIIGSADGPTAIFLAGKLSGDLFNFLIIAGVVLVAAVVILYWKKKR